MKYVAQKYPKHHYSEHSAEHSTHSCLPGMGSNGKGMSTAKMQHHSFLLGKNMSPAPKAKGFSRFQPCPQHSSCVFIFNIKGEKKKRWDTKQGRNHPLRCLKRRKREEKGTNSTLLGNTELLLVLHKNEAERDLDNNRNSHSRSQFVQPRCSALKWAKNHFFQCSSAGALFQQGLDRISWLSQRIQPHIRSTQSSLWSFSFYVP